MMKKFIRIIFLLALIAYGIWWMRPLALPDVPVDLSQLQLSEVTALEKEDNLGYTIQGSGAIWLSELVDQYDRSELFKDKPLLSDFFSLREFREIEANGDPSLPETKRARELVLSGYYRDLSLEDYFSGLNISELEADIQAHQSDFNNLIDKIIEQERYTDDIGVSLGKSFGVNKITSNNSNISKLLSVLAVKACSEENYDRCSQLLKANYLLGHKMHERNIYISTMIGHFMKKNALSTMYFISQKYPLPQSVLEELKTLLEQFPEDAEKVYHNALASEYQTTLEIISFFEENSLLKSFFTSKKTEGLLWIEKIFPIFDGKESKKIADLYFSETLKGNIFDISSFDKGLWKENRWNSSDHYMKSYLDQFNPLSKVLRRKNSIGVSILTGMLGERFSGTFGSLQDLENYQNFVHAQL